MNAPALPGSVPFVRFEAFLARAGIPIADLVELHVDRHGITATRRWRDRDGRLIVTRHDFATVTTFIPFDR